MKRTAMENNIKINLKENKIALCSGFICLKEGSCEHFDESSESTKYGKFLK
jgi:hypothetical protein